MKLEQSFEVQAPLEQVWQALIDVERVAPCLPGAEVTGRNDDGTYDGSFKVKIGPTAAAYSGKLAMQEIDEAAHRATMDAHGTDRRGQGGAKATIVSSVQPAGADATRVSVDTDYHITGRLARFGRGGMIEEISNRLLGEFARNLQDMLAHEQASGGAAAAAPTGDGAQVPATQVTGQAAAADTLEAPAREQGEATAQTLTEAAKRVAQAGDASTTQAPDAQALAAAAADQPAPLGDDDPGEEAAAPPIEPAEPAAPPIEPEAAPVTGSAEPAAPPIEPAEPAAPPIEPEAAPVTGSAEPAAPPAPAGPSAPSGAGPAAAASSAQSTWTPPVSQSQGVDGLSLVGSVLVARIKRNPVPVVALVLGFLLALRILRRGES